MDDECTVEVTSPDEGIRLIRINRPKFLNALNLDVKRRIEAALNEAERTADIRAIIVTGSQTAFVAGTDIAEMQTMTPAMHAELGTGRVFERLRNCTKLTIAAVEGFALGGGCELALACDLVIAGSKACFGQPEIKVGIMPGGGGTQVLLRSAGAHWTLKKVLTGEQFSAEEALKMGVISEVVDAGNALLQALATAAKINSMPEKSVDLIRDAVKKGAELPLPAALAYERRAFESLFGGADQIEGMRAFLEKRTPKYKKLN